MTGIRYVDDLLLKIPLILGKTALYFIIYISNTEHPNKVYCIIFLFSIFKLLNITYFSKNKEDGKKVWQEVYSECGMDFLNQLFLFLIITVSSCMGFIYEGISLGDTVSLYIVFLFLPFLTMFLTKDEMLQFIGYKSLKKWWIGCEIITFILYLFLYENYLHSYSFWIQMSIYLSTFILKKKALKMLY